VADKHKQLQKINAPVLGDVIQAAGDVIIHHNYYSLRPTHQPTVQLTQLGSTRENPSFMVPPFFNNLLDTATSSNAHLQLCGMGGMGKTTVLRQLYHIFAKRGERIFEHIAYFEYNGSCEQMLNTPLSGKEQDEVPIQFLIRQAETGKLLILIDDISKRSEAIDLSCFDCVNASIVLASRKPCDGYTLIDVGDKQNILSLGELRELFLRACYQNQPYPELNEAEYDSLHHILEERAARHYLVVQRLGAIAYDYVLLPSELDKLLNENGFELFTNDEQKLDEEICKLYPIEQLTDTQINMLSALCVFSGQSVSLSTWAKWLSSDVNLNEYDCRRELNKLRKLAWLCGTNDVLYLHQIVSEAILRYVPVVTSAIFESLIDTGLFPLLKKYFDSFHGNPYEMRVDNFLKEATKHWHSICTQDFWDRHNGMVPFAEQYELYSCNQSFRDKQLIFANLLLMQHWNDSNEIVDCIRLYLKDAIHFFNTIFKNKFFHIFRDIKESAILTLIDAYSVLELPLSPIEDADIYNSMSTIALNVALNSDELNQQAEWFGKAINNAELMFHVEPIQGAALLSQCYVAHADYMAKEFDDPLSSQDRDDIELFQKFREYANAIELWIEHKETKKSNKFLAMTYMAYTGIIDIFLNYSVNWFFAPNPSEQELLAYFSDSIEGLEEDGKDYAADYWFERISCLSALLTYSAIHGEEEETSQLFKRLCNAILQAIQVEDSQKLTAWRSFNGRIGRILFYLKQKKTNTFFEMLLLNELQKLFDLLINRELSVSDIPEQLRDEPCWTDFAILTAGNAGGPPKFDTMLLECCHNLAHLYAENGQKEISIAIVEKCIQKYSNAIELNNVRDFFHRHVLTDNLHKLETLYQTITNTQHSA